MHYGVLNYPVISCFGCSIIVKLSILWTLFIHFVSQPMTESLGVCPNLLWSAYLVPLRCLRGIVTDPRRIMNKKMWQQKSKIQGRCCHNNHIFHDRELAQNVQAQFQSHNKSLFNLAYEPQVAPWNPAVRGSNKWC